MLQPAEENQDPASFLLKAAAMFGHGSGNIAIQRRSFETCASLHTHQSGFPTSYSVHLKHFADD
jgi:hypothetical protein